MASKDAVTGRGPMFGNNRSKALNATKRKWNLNLQPVTIIIGGKKQKIMISTKTLRTMKKKGQIK